MKTTCFNNNNELLDFTLKLEFGFSLFIYYFQIKLIFSFCFATSYLRSNIF